MAYGVKSVWVFRHYTGSFERRAERSFLKVHGEQLKRLKSVATYHVRGGIDEEGWNGSGATLTFEIKCGLWI